MAASLLFLARQFTPTVVSDVELLAQFIRTRDNETFADLVRRHGPMIYRICRRLVGEGAADDAFQATFLVLATRATAALNAHSIGGWLVGVAGRVSRQIRRANQRRQHHESSSTRQPQGQPADSTPELTDQFRILEEELTRLPDHLRAPLVSCLLRGMTQEEAAAESGHTARTVRRRLDEAKQLLRVRLLRRGVTPALASGLIAGLASVSTAFPDTLVARTVQVVFDFLTGGPAVASPPVLIAKGVTSTMLTRKVMAMMMVFAVGLTTLGILLAEDPKPSSDPFATKSSGQQSSQGQPPANTLPAPKEKSQNKTLDYVKQTIDQLAKELKPGEQRILVNALLLCLPAGFFDECGLFPDKPANGPSIMATTLNHREESMLKTLFRVMKPSMTIDVIARHRAITMEEGITGCISVRRNESSYTAGAKVPKSEEITSTSVPSFGLRFTPTIDKGTGLIQMEIQATTAQLGELVQLAKVHSVHSIDHLTADLAPVSIPSAGTIAVGGTVESVKDKTKREWLWVLEAHIVRGQK
jgi:RNA polymerase sigma factor (sigma-70 family)